jgi:hypothetical protein
MDAEPRHWSKVGVKKIGLRLLTQDYTVEAVPLNWNLAANISIKGLGIFERL